MEFSKFSGTDEKGNLVKTEMVSTNVSQGSRAMANSDPSDSIRHESYEEEYVSLVSEKKKLESQIANRYSRGAYTEAQMAVRRSNPGNSLHEWMKFRTMMDGERAALLEKLANVERKIQEVSPKLKAEREREHARQIEERKKNREDYGIQIIDLLTEIRNLLRDKNI